MRSPRAGDADPQLDPAVRALLAEVSQSSSGEPSVTGERHVSAGDHEEWAVVDCEHSAAINVRVCRPTAVTDPAPAIVYVRGGDVLSGAAATRDRLIRHLVEHTGATVVCPDYGSAWSVGPQTVEQIYAVCRWVTTNGAAHGIDVSRIAIAGDSIGATLAVSVAQMSTERRDVTFQLLVAFCPLADSSMSGPSRERFAEGFLLSSSVAGRWWQQFSAGPDADADRFVGMPPTLLVTAEADPVRDEGERLAGLLRHAGVPTTSVQYGGMVHDFVALDALAKTPAVESALRQATSALSLALGCTAASGLNPSAPVLTDDQWRALIGYGHPRHAASGEVLFQAGQTGCDMIVVESGTVEVVRRATAESAEAVIAHYGPGQFTGELNLLSGQATYFDARVSTTGTIVRIDRRAFRRLMDEQPELSDLILQALVSRRQNLLTRQAGTIEILAGTPSAPTLALHTYLDRLQLPYTWSEYGSDAGIRLAREAGLTVTDLPAVITAETVIDRATPARLAEAFGLSGGVLGAGDVDVVVIGAGPAGLGAAVYGASEGLRTLVLESVAPGGQAAKSSRIENYLGFTSGLSGSDLTGRASIQAQKFGARIDSPRRVVGVEVEGHRIRVRLDDGAVIDTRSVVIATGARYRALPLERWHEFEGAGIYYAATELEARRCAAEPVTVVGGANSAGQAALFLAERGSTVDVCVRNSTLTAGMSAYLADRILAHPRITVRTGTEVIGLDGTDHLGTVTTATTGDSGEVTTTQRACVGLFCFIGAAPATDWLSGVALDERGFILTDAQIPSGALGPVWTSRNRRPLPFETSVPAIMAVGDVRAGSIKRVAAAVGEGSSAISSVHRALADTPSGLPA